MQILSVNRKTTLEEIGWRNGEPVLTGIDKQPVATPLMITPDGLEGDRIADKKHHGGQFKAIYLYAAEHYDFWRQELNRPALAYGGVGENLTTQGLDEETVCIGDQLQVGDAVIQATEPRQPCWILSKHLEDKTMVKRFLDSGRLGIYYKVIQPGLVKAGDAIKRLVNDPAGVPVSEITRLHTRDKQDIAGLERVLQVSTLPPEWRDTFQKQLAKLH